MASRIVTTNEMEMLLALYHLRYLTAGQIHQLWYGTRSRNAADIRLCRLAASGLIERRRCVISNDTAYSLTSSGLRRLRELRNGDFRPTPPLSPTYLPHHLATSAVFAALAQGPAVVWEQLPFSWIGTLGAAIRFEESRRDEFGALRTRTALLRPDAIVSVGKAGPRVFVELDRSSECIREGDERRSIRRKLRAYGTVLLKGKVGDAQTWYAGAFPDGRAARVVFVLARTDRQSQNRIFRDRRIRSIETAARDVEPRIDVKCLYLGDVFGLREACGLAAGSAPAASASVPELRLLPADVHQLATFYRLAVGALRNQENADPALRTAAHDAKAVLKRLREGGEAR